MTSARRCACQASETSTYVPPARDASAEWCPASRGSRPARAAGDQAGVPIQRGALAVVQTQAQPREPALQQSILFEQERDDIGLLTLEPSAQRGDQQLERAQSKPTPVPSIVRCDTTRFVIMLNDIASVSATMPPRAAGLEFSVCRAAFDKATGRIPLPRCCPSSIDRRRVRSCPLRRCLQRHSRPSYVDGNCRLCY